MFQLEKQIRLGFGDAERLGEALEVYRMMADPAERDNEIVSTWMALYWNSRLPDEAISRSQLSKHLNARLVLGQTVSVDAELIEQAQRELRRRWINDGRRKQVQIVMALEIVEQLQAALEEFKSAEEVRKGAGGIIFQPFSL